MHKAHFTVCLNCSKLITLLSCSRQDEKYCVLVPFVVLQELDGLKSRTGNNTIKNSASIAIRFIYNQLKSRNQHLQGLNEWF